jgi:hypothetical protein
VRPGDDAGNFDWSPACDVLGIVHWTWHRERSNYWHRLCLDEGAPEAAGTRGSRPPLETPVTCFWCLSVWSTL